MAYLGYKTVYTLVFITCHFLINRLTLTATFKVRISPPQFNRGSASKSTLVVELSPAFVADINPSAEFWCGLEVRNIAACGFPPFWWYIIALRWS